MIPSYSEYLLIESLKLDNKCNILNEKNLTNEIDNDMTKLLLLKSSLDTQYSKEKLALYQNHYMNPNNNFDNDLNTITKNYNVKFFELNQKANDTIKKSKKTLEPYNDDCLIDLKESLSDYEKKLEKLEFKM